MISFIMCVNRNHSSHFENAKAAFEEGHDEIEDNIPGEAAATATTGTETKQIHTTDEIEKVSVDREIIGVACM